MKNNFYYFYYFILFLKSFMAIFKESYQKIVVETKLYSLQ